MTTDSYIPLPPSSSHYLQGNYVNLSPSPYD